MSVAMTANHELPIPTDVWVRLGLQPGEEFEVLAEQDQLIAVRKNARTGEHFRTLMARLDYVQAGRHFGRGEANER